MQLGVPPIGLGTGGVEYLDGDQCVDIVTAALDMGYRHVDTAQSYGNEAAVGRAIARSPVPRGDLLVATKVARANLAHDDVIASADRSRTNLGVDTIDLLYVHFPTRTYEPTETLPAFDRLVDDGVVDHIGLSNFSPSQLDEARGILEHPVAAIQAELHPLWRQERLVAYAQRNGIPLIAYAPLARGRVFEIDPLTAIAEKHGVSEAAVTLAWLTGIEPVAAIPKTTSTIHLRENLEAVDLTLDPDDIAAIEAIETEEKLVEIA